MAVWQTSLDWSDAMFEWDTSFVSFLATIAGEDSKYLAFCNIISLVKGRAAHGYLVDFFAGATKNPGSSKPPVTAKVLHEIHQVYNEPWLVHLLLPDLNEWHAWFLRRRKANGAEAAGSVDLLSLGAHNQAVEDGAAVTPGQEAVAWGAVQEGRYESGADNSPMYDCGREDCSDLWNNSTHRMRIHDVGQSSLWAQDVGAAAELGVVH